MPWTSKNILSLYVYPIGIEVAHFRTILWEVANSCLGMLSEPGVLRRTRPGLSGGLWQPSLWAVWSAWWMHSICWKKSIEKEKAHKGHARGKVRDVCPCMRLFLISLRSVLTFHEGKYQGYTNNKSVVYTFVCALGSSKLGALAQEVIEQVPNAEDLMKNEPLAFLSQSTVLFCRDPSKSGWNRSWFCVCGRPNARFLAKLEGGEEPDMEMHLMTALSQKDPKYMPRNNASPLVRWVPRAWYFFLICKAWGIPIWKHSHIYVC